MYKLRLRMPRHASLSLALAALMLALPAGGQTGEPQAPYDDVVDRVVAVVQLRSGVAERRAGASRSPPDLITLSGLQFEARVALIGRGALRAAVDPLDDGALRSALGNAISERLLAGEAEMLQAFRVEPAEVDTSVRAFRERFASDEDFREFLARHEADLQALARVLERTFRAVKVLDGKVRLRSQVTEAEVRAFYEANRGRLRGEYETLRPVLREGLVRERYQKLVEAELEQLRRTHEVRQVAPFTRTAQGEGPG